MKPHLKIVFAGALVAAGVVGGIFERQQRWAYFTEKDGEKFLKSQGYELVWGGKTGHIFFNSCGRGSLSREYTVTMDGRVKQNTTVCYNYLRGVHRPLIDW